jgi:hypothetical protein
MSPGRGARATEALWHCEPVMQASEPNNTAPVDCQSLRGGGWLRVATTASIVGFPIVLGVVKLGQQLAAILAAAALGATVVFVALLRFSCGRWSALARSGRFCAMATFNPNGRRPSVGVLTIDELALTWSPTRRSRRGSETVSFAVERVDSIEYGTWSRLTQDSVLIIRPANSPPVGLRVFSRPSDLARWLPDRLRVIRCQRTADHGGATRSAERQIGAPRDYAERQLGARPEMPDSGYLEGSDGER